MAKAFRSTELSRLCGLAEYDYLNKKAYLSMGRMILKRLAEQMGLSKGNCSVRLCEGGPAVAGEIILHSDHLYLQIHPAWAGQGAQIMYRTCKGQKDYSGGPNQRASIGELDDLEHFANKLLRFTGQLCDRAA